MTPIWDYRYPWAQYAYFEEYIVQPLLRLLGYPCHQTFSLEIKKFLHPKEYDERQIINHNSKLTGMLSKITKIKVYGYEGVPFLLPIIVPNRIAYLENVRQLAASSSSHLGSHGKQSLMPGTLCFGEFTIYSTKGYGLIESKLAHYGL